MESARLKETKTTMAEIMVDKQGTTLKRKYVGKWWEGLSMKLRRRRRKRKTTKSTNGMTSKR